MVRRVASETKEAPVDEAVDQTTFITTKTPVLFYRAALPQSRQTLTFVSGIIRRR